MFGHLPFWPESASSNAGNVDALYIFLLMVSGIMTAHDLQRADGLRHQVPPA